MQGRGQACPADGHQRGCRVQLPPTRSSWLSQALPSSSTFFRNTNLSPGALQVMVQPHLAPAPQGSDFPWEFLLSNLGRNSSCLNPTTCWEAEGHIVPPPKHSAED